MLVILASDDAIYALVHLTWFAVLAGLLHHERWHRPAALAVWTRYAAYGTTDERQR